MQQLVWVALTLPVVARAFRAPGSGPESLANAARKRLAEISLADFEWRREVARRARTGLSSRDSDASR